LDLLSRSKPEAGFVRVRVEVDQHRFVKAADLPRQIMVASKSEAGRAGAGAVGVLANQNAFRPLRDNL
jgi:hypothetical protein